MAPIFDKTFEKVVEPHFHMFGDAGDGQTDLALCPFEAGRRRRQTSVSVEGTRLIGTSRHKDTTDPPDQGRARIVKKMAILR
jgi:hypothetical protein